MVGLLLPDSDKGLAQLQRCAGATPRAFGQGTPWLPSQDDPVFAHAALCLCMQFGSISDYSAGLAHMECTQRALDLPLNSLCLSYTCMLGAYAD